MDASFAQVLLVVSATAILMGRRETLTVARYVGVGFGRFVGTLQGYRAKYEGSARDSALYQMQSSVRKELNELRGIGLDMSMVSSHRLSFNDTASMVKKAEESRHNAMHVGGMNTDSGANMNIQTAIHQVPTFPPQLSSHTINQTGSNVSDVSVCSTFDDEEQLFKLSRAILAEEQIRATSKGVASVHDKMDSGADIISSCVTESILNRAYRVQQQSSNSRVDPDSF